MGERLIQREEGGREKLICHPERRRRIRQAFGETRGAGMALKIAG
jgi:hypothetical protein